MSYNFSIMTIEELEKFGKSEEFESLEIEALKNDNRDKLRILFYYYNYLLLKYKNEKRYDKYIEICKFLAKNRDKYCVKTYSNKKDSFYKKLDITNNCLNILSSLLDANNPHLINKENKEVTKKLFILILKYETDIQYNNLFIDFKDKILELLPEEEIVKFKDENLKDNNNLLGNYYYLLSLQDDIAEDKQIELLKKSSLYNNDTAKMELTRIYLQKAKSTKNDHQKCIEYCVKCLIYDTGQRRDIINLLDEIIPNLNLPPLYLQEHSNEQWNIINNLQILARHKLINIQKYLIQKYFGYDNNDINKMSTKQINILYNIIDNEIDLNKPNNDNINNINEIKFRLAISYIKYGNKIEDGTYIEVGEKKLLELSNNGYTRATNYLNKNTKENNTKLEQIINIILQNNNEFSIQAFLKKIILEGINFTDDNIVYLTERFGDKIDVETFVFMKEIYNKLIIGGILLCKDETKISNNINNIITINIIDNVYNNLTPKVIAIKHYLKNKLHNETIDENPLYSRIITVDDNDEKLENTLTYYLELSKTTQKPYYIHFNNGEHSSFFIIQNGTFAYIDSIGNRYTPPHDNPILQDAFLGSQNIKIQSKLGCRIYTGLGMIILDEYIKKYGIENLEDLGKKVEFSKDELGALNCIINSQFTKNELKLYNKNELEVLKKDYNYLLLKIKSLTNVRKELRKKEINKEEKLQLQQLEEKVVKNIKTTLQNTINQEKQENKENTSITEQSLLKLLQFINPKKESIDIDKDFEEIILLFNRVNLDISKVFSLTHLLFPLAQTMSLVNTYIDHNEQLKEADIKIKEIKNQVKVNHFVNDFREDILSRFNKIEELSKKIDEQKLQNMKFFETPIEELLINEEIKETEEIEQEGKTTKEIPYPDFVSQNDNEYIVALLEAVISSREMFERYTNSIYFKQKFAYV